MKTLDSFTNSFFELLKKPITLPYLGIFIVLVSTFNIFQSGDDQALLKGLTHAFACLADSPIKLPCGVEVVHFPIFQYLVATPFKIIGLSDASIIQIFAGMSVAWTLIAGAAFWRAGYISAAQRGGHLSLLVLLSGYLLFYMTSSFNEAASFALMALLVLSVIDQWRIIFVCLIAFACTLTKEIAFPFVLYFMFLAFMAREIKLDPTVTLLRRIAQFLVQYKFVMASVLAGIAINISFNYFRFGTYKNLSLLAPDLFTPWEYVPEFFVDLFISPAGGLIFIWLSLCVLLIAPLMFLIRNRLEMLIMGAAILGLIGANLGFARWWSSFGWNAWGPRLTLPVLGAIAILAVYIVIPYVIEYFQRVRTKKWGYIIFILIAVSSLPNVAVRINSDLFFGKMFGPATVKADLPKPITVPAHPYQEMASEAYSRNIIIPTTVEVTLKKGPILLLWLLSLYFINRHIFAPVRDSNKMANSPHQRVANNSIIAQIQSTGLTRQIVITLIALLLLSGSMLSTLTAHEAYQATVYFLQKKGLMGVKAQYQVIPPHEDLVKHLATFPAALPLVEIQIELNEPKILDTVRVLSPNGGEWTSRPVDPGLWGIVILDKEAGNKVLNDWPRTELMNLPVGRKLTLWIPNNGDLSQCPKFELELSFSGGKRVNALAGCGSPL